MERRWFASSPSVTSCCCCCCCYYYCYCRVCDRCTSLTPPHWKHPGIRWDECIKPPRLLSWKTPLVLVIFRTRYVFRGAARVLLVTSYVHSDDGDGGGGGGDGGGGGCWWRRRRRWWQKWCLRRRTVFSTIAYTQQRRSVVLIMCPYDLNSTWGFISNEFL